MQVTHEEVRKLIQLNADNALDMQARTVLSAHLRDCLECRTYAEEIKEMEMILVPVMKRHWNVQPIPLSLGVLVAKGNSKTQTGIILATRLAAIGIVFLTFVFSAWQLALSGRQTTGPLPVGMLPVPTPSVQSTSTRAASPNCTGTLYSVQENDTLASIAQHFAVSEEEIMAINGMKTETVTTTMELMIPNCNSTPTGTVNPTAFSTTYTPTRGLVTSTLVPAGSY